MINRTQGIQLSENRNILAQGKDFVYVLPCEELRNLISNFTITFPDQEVITDTYTVLPHGSVTLVIFTYHGQQHRFLFGPTASPCRVGDLANRCDSIFIVEFQPAGFYPFHKICQQELRDAIIPLAALDAALDNELHTVYQNASCAEELLYWSEQILLRRMSYSSSPEFISAMNYIICQEGKPSATDISNKVSYGPKQLNRLFYRYLGMSMKAFSRLVRINKALRLLHDETSTLQKVSEQLHYYDSSHFVKDFKTVCGITPQTYKLNMSNFYNEIAKYG